MITQQLNHNINSEITTLATCWKLRLRSGRELGFTDFDQDISFENLHYLASSGFTASAIDSSAKLETDNFQIEAMINTDEFSSKDIMAGMFDHSYIEIFLVNYNDVTMGAIYLKSGFIGKVRVAGQKFIAEISGLKEKLHWQIGEIFSPLCSAKLGDGRCNKNLSNFSHEFMIDEVHSPKSFACLGIDQFPQGYFNFGVAEFEGIKAKFEIKNAHSNIMNLSLMPYFTVTQGMRIRAIAGCDKKFSSCCDKFANALNFRGQPHIPTNIVLS